MTPSELSVIVQSTLTLILLAFIMFVWWPEQRVDLFRQQMFALRDELFDFAMGGNIGFDDPAYLRLRYLMNGFIRYAHNVTPYRTSCHFYGGSTPPGRQPPREWSVLWEQALKEVLDQDTKAKVQEFHSRASLLVVGPIGIKPWVADNSCAFANSRCYVLRTMD